MGVQFRGSIPRLHLPLSTLHLRRYRRKYMTRSQCGSLLLHCMKLSFTTPCRLLPAHLNVWNSIRLTALVECGYLVLEKDFFMRPAGLFDRQKHFQSGPSPSAVGGQRPVAHDRIVECVDPSVAPVLSFDAELNLVYLVVAIHRETAGSHAHVSLIEACDQWPAHNP